MSATAPVASVVWLCPILTSHVPSRTTRIVPASWQRLWHSALSSPFLVQSVHMSFAGVVQLNSAVAQLVYHLALSGIFPVRMYLRAPL